MPPTTEKFPLHTWVLPILYLFGRFFLYLTLVPNELYGSGPLPLYYQWAELRGWPFIDHWIDYPPVFPFLNELIYRAIGGQHFVYDFLMTMLFAFSGAGAIALFQKISAQLYPENEAFLRAVVFTAILTPLPHTWWNFEMFTVMVVLAGLYLLINNRHSAAGLVIGFGMLTKWFPGFLLAADWRSQTGLPRKSWKNALRTTAIAFGLVLLVLVPLWLISPRMTQASLVSQLGRSSWQTLWAMIDGNKVTGMFALVEEHYDPAIAGIPRNNPAVIPTWATLIVFGGIGLILFLKVRDLAGRSLVAFTGITWALFLLWSPGWTPSWMFYLLPLILLTLPLQRGMLISLALVFLTVMEWPFLLRRYLFDGLWVIAPLRMVIFALLAVLWYRLIKSEGKVGPLSL